MRNSDDETMSSASRTAEDRAPARPANRANAAPAETSDPDTRSEASPEDRRKGLAASPPEICPRDPLEVGDQYSTASLNRAFKAQLARATVGVTPFGLASTFFSWGVHLAGSPGKQARLNEKAMRKLARLALYMGASARDPDAQPCIEPLPHDNRFEGEEWKQWPYNLISQTFLLHQQWWYNATTEVDGLTRHQENVVSFVTRQMLDIVSPSNFLPTNPVITQKTIDDQGQNLVRGAQHAIEDWERTISGKPPVGAENYLPGRDVATAEGKVVYRNHLIELIQYAPQTETVMAEPVLIIPAWIMKYYILDLSPHNSLVKYLVSQGYTVFMVSWRNPTAEDRDLGMDDYHTRGVMAAIDAVTDIVPDTRVHATGYCIGGTLLAIAAARMARDGDDRLQSLSFLATQTDFADAGELTLFVSESEVSYLENMMWDQGYLDTKQMAGAFRLLRSNDLIWSRYVKEYLMGKRQDMFDLMAWNADATRMPYRMHSEYLRKLFLQNELAQGKYECEGRPVALRDMTQPAFCVSTTSDHIAPWRSVFKLHLLADTDITFVLTSGGHNAGIVSEPGHEGRSFQIRTTREQDRFLSPESWREEAEQREGSWWLAWADWLEGHSTGRTSPPEYGGGKRAYRPKVDAPGTYVYQT